MSLTDELKKKWTRKDGQIDQHMVDYCLKSTNYIDMGDYFLNLSDKKPTIRKTIYYADIDYDTGEVAKDPGTSWDVFYNYNMRLNSGKHWIDEIEAGEVEVTIHKQNEKSDIMGWTTKRWHEEPRNNGRIATDEEKEIILAGLKDDLARYEKRLVNYFNRYGKHINTSSYWADR